MSFNVDPAFKKSGSKSRARRRRKKRNRLIAFASLGLGIIALVGGVFFLWPEPSATPIAGHDDTGVDATSEGGSEDGFAMVQTENSSSMAASIAEAAFIDLPRDPMILNFDQSTSASRQNMSGPASLNTARIGPPDAERLTLIEDDLVQAEARLVTTIPSTREDFALFQAKRSQGIEAMETAQTEAVAEAVVEANENRGELVSVDSSEESSWGELIGGAGENGEEGADNAVYVETVIENTTSVAFLRREAQRIKLFTDIVIILQVERSLSEVLTSNGFNEETAALIVKAAERDIGEVSKLPAASIVALRVSTPEGSRQQLQQLSLYNPDAYRASLARVGAGRYSISGDPWYAENLMAGGRQQQAQSGASADNVRLLDGLYSAGIRNELSTTMVGEIIVAMAQLYDLDRIADEDDKITILHSNTPGRDGKGLGAVLFAAIKGPSGDLSCYIAPKTSGDGYACINQRSGGGGVSGGLGGGLIVPVSGTRTSSFGPRMHPVLKQLRNHNGVDWGAPTGTPIHAAAAGKISRSAVSSSYGNVVYIDHGQGVETRYAHMNSIAPAARQGARVEAGQLIGYVGTTGRSTGPHLHFELRVGGTAVDPVTYRGGSGGGGGGGGGGSGSGAVEALVNKIIRVESGGNANAQNPNSSATGLGQFINSTWLRMMRTYRPDLVQSLSQAELLALRTNPELSREMVRNLARENEAFLRGKGHSITAGRLYLAHFLGPGGANIALRADPNATVLAIMGAGVVNANGFLRGWNISQLTAWSDRKMSGASGRSTGRSTPTAPRLTTDQRAYIKAIDALLEDKT